MTPAASPAPGAQASADTGPVRPLVERLQDESDLCRNDGADDVAALLTEAADEIERLSAQRRELQAERERLLDARDCRTCRNFTTRSGGCVSVLRCVDGSAYKRQGVVQMWEAAPVNAGF